MPIDLLTLIPSYVQRLRPDHLQYLKSRINLLVKVHCSAALAGAYISVFEIITALGRDQRLPRESAGTAQVRARCFYSRAKHCGRHRPAQQDEGSAVIHEAE